MTPHEAGSYNPRMHRSTRAATSSAFVWFLLGVACGAAALAAWTPATAFAARGGRAVRVLAEDARGVRVEYQTGSVRFDTLAIGPEAVRYERVRVEGALMLEAPGRPALPTDLLQIAIPEGAAPQLRIEVEEYDDRPGYPPIPAVHQKFVSDLPNEGPRSEFRYDPDPGIYAGVNPYPESAARLGAGNALGELWMAPIRVSPVRWNPATRSYRVLRRLVVSVSFAPEGERDRSVRVAARPGSDAGSWRRIQDRTLLNHASARAFARRPREAAPAPRARRLLDGNPEFRISVTQTGWTSVPYATLSAAGFPSGIAIAKIGVWERGYNDAADTPTATPIPVVARDVGTIGTFDAGDVITFAARSLRDRVGGGSIENRYADANVYWLTWTTADAAVPGSITGSIADPSPLMPTWFYDVIRLEQDNRILSSPDYFSAFPPENISYLFWTNGQPPPLGGPEDFTTSIPFVDPEPGQTFRIRSRYQGQTGSAHRLQIFFQGGGSPTDTLANAFVFVGQEVFLLDTGFNIPSSHIAAGTNTYRHLGTRQPSGGSTFIDGSAAWLDVIEATYPRKFVARGDYLAFNSGTQNGICELTVTGFTSSGIEVYDVTDPIAPLRVTGVLIGLSSGGGGLQALFRTDATAGPRNFVAFVTGAEFVVSPRQVTADVTSSLGVPGAFGAGKVARSIIVAPAPFLAAATRLADHRRAQGYVVEVAEVQDIYDEFNGGIKSAHAIRRYIRHAYLTWTPAPTFVVLAGDASMDHKKRLAGSSHDWVPTYLRFEEIFGPAGRELVAHDSYYMLGLENPLPLDGNLAPRLALGRIPAGTAAELDQFITKVIAYEGYQATDAWRGRLLFLSDDALSAGLFSTFAYCEQPVEAAFEATNDALTAAAAANPGTTDLQSTHFRLRTFTDPLAPVCPSGLGPNCRFIACVVDQLRTGGGYSTFQNQVAGGALIVNYQGHANRYLLGHEELFRVSRPGISGDEGDLGNADRPSLFMVWGCHGNQFPDGQLGIGDIDSTDAIGEVWLGLPDRGAIASVGSTAYEILEANAGYNLIVGNAFFGAPPSVVGPGGVRRARWILGEVLLQAAVVNASTSFFQQIMNRTVGLLGDPMTQMDALPPRVFEVSLDGNVVASGAPLTSDSPTDSIALSAKVRDEVAVTRLIVAERDLLSSATTPLDSTLFTVVFSDTSRQAVLTGRVRPRVGNYDVLIQATDFNGRVEEFPLAVRTPIRYFANGVEIVDGVFVESSALLRAEVMSPIPLTADSLTLLLDGIVISAAPTALDGTGRRWALESLAGDRGPGNRTLQLAVGGRTSGLDDATFQISSQFTLRGVAIVDPRRQGAGCGGSIFQYELSAPANRVELQLYTVAGRRVASIPLPGAAGFNVYCWDGRDSQGHHSAMGVYLYRITAHSSQGESAKHVSRFIRTR